MKSDLTTAQAPPPCVAPCPSTTRVCFPSRSQDSCEPSCISASRRLQPGQSPSVFDLLSSITATTSLSVSCWARTHVVRVCRRRNVANDFISVVSFLLFSFFFLFHKCELQCKACLVCILYRFMLLLDVSYCRNLNSRNGTSGNE